MEPFVFTGRLVGVMKMACICPLVFPVPALLSKAFTMLADTDRHMFGDIGF